MSKPLPEPTDKDIQRFWSKVERGGPDECWNWNAGTRKGGYGQFKLSGRSVIASRVAFLLGHGYDPGDAMVCHECDHPPCCNPAHLYDGSGASNYADAKRRGRLNTACGERHGSRTKPESRARGERVASAVLTAEQVSELRSLYASGAFTQQALADRFGVKRETIGTVVRGARWQHIGFDREATAIVSRSNRGKPGELNQSAKLTAYDVTDIRQRHKTGQWSYRRLAAEFGVTTGAIAHIIRRVSWKHVP